MTGPQKETCSRFIVELSPSEFRHGDCIGSDEEAHGLVREFAKDCRIIVHPPLNESYRAFCVGDRICPQEDYLKRDRAIVRASSIFLATPAGFQEEIRSGTWYTVRYAESCNLRTLIVFPDGLKRWRNP